MVLSVIIVSYNVKYFLEQCLCSVQRAMGNDVEVFVTDNNSSDGTLEYLRDKFPFVQFISNVENVGFAKANNQALEKAKGEYVLFLNPDTIIPEDLFSLCTGFLQSHTDAGALGVRMIDGSGEFLPESKRGFPSPWVAFCKMSGLTGIFPRSKTFAKYYLGHLPELETNVVDALAGACMFVRKEVFNKIGGFDEQFFMYAEDIDLSYRIGQVGYKNYYFPGCTIIHFKGESTRKDARYIRLFYKAMIQFVRKHFKGKKAGAYIFLLEWGIRMKSVAASLGLRGAKKKKPVTGKSDLLIIGEKQGIEKVALKVFGYNNIELLDKIADVSLIEHTISKSSYSEIVFCESASLSFKKIIQCINLSKSKAAFKICATGSNSLVGSSSKSNQGDAIRLL
jgi:N-acetylglucosaminyl-diphospho-decaprenol L-rhamnosyltransferase